MTKPTLTPKSYLTTITIMHLSFFAAMLFLAGISYYLNQNHLLDFENIDLIYLMLLVLVGLFGIFVGQTVKRKHLEKATSQSSLRQKLVTYQTASIINYAFVEAPAILGIILYIQTSEFLYLLVALILMIYFLALRPTKEKISNSLQLNRDHQIEFNRDNQELN